MKNEEDIFLRKKATGFLRTYEDLEEEDDDEEIDIIEPGSEEEKKGILEAKATALAMRVSLITISLVFMVVGAVVCAQRVSLLIGAVTGMATGLFFLWHLNRSLKTILNMDEKAAESAIRKDALVRLLVLVVVDCIVMFLVKGYSPIGVLLELLALKISVYLTPFFQKKVEKYVS